MKKICANCSLYKPTDSIKGDCGFWLTIVSKEDYCVEYKSMTQNKNK